MGRWAIRASTIPLLDNEPLVVVRASFLALCDGDHCAAALLNSFVYWHDWCVTHGRYDTTATAADPSHQPADPERWFWKTMDGLVNDDLLRLWDEKKVRAAVELLEAKGYAQSRFNPKNRYDRTKQYRLVPERLTADLQGRSPRQDRPESGTPEPPNAFSKKAGSTQSTTYVDSSIRQNCRMELAKTRALPTETTYSEITKYKYPSFSSCESARVAEERKEGCLYASPARVEINVADFILEWASERHVRCRRDDRSYGGPDLHWATKWGSYCGERGIDDRNAVFEVMDRAKAAADLRAEWRYWKYLDEQVQQSAERYIPHAAESASLPQPLPRRPVEDAGSEWAQVKRLVQPRVSTVGYANWIEPTCQIGRSDTKLIIWLPDEATRVCLETEYAEQVSEALASVGLLTIEYTQAIFYESHTGALLGGLQSLSE